MGPKLGPEKAFGLGLNEKVVHAPTVAEVDHILAQYAAAQKNYFSIFEKAVYRAYAGLSDTIGTSQGA